MEVERNYTPEMWSKSHKVLQQCAGQHPQALPEAACPTRAVTAALKWVPLIYWVQSGKITSFLRIVWALSRLRSPTPIHLSKPEKNAIFTALAEYISLHPAVMLLLLLHKLSGLELTTAMCSLASPYQSQKPQSNSQNFLLPEYYFMIAFPDTSTI